MRQIKSAKEYSYGLLALVVALGMTGCNNSADSTASESKTSVSDISDDNNNVTADNLGAETTGKTEASKVIDSEEDNAKYPDMGKITLNNDSIAYEGDGATVSGSTVTITKAGLYTVSGKLTDGQIIVNAQKEDKVKILLNSADITCKTSAPIYVQSADKLVVSLAENTTNTLTDSNNYTYTDTEAEEPNACIFSKDDLTINGGGKLIVNANFNNGIQSKDDLKINGGDITISSVSDGIKGKDSVQISGGTVTVNSGADGIQSTNAEEEGKGYVLVTGGVLNITAALDAVQAETTLDITGGTFYLSSTGNSTDNSGIAALDWGGGFGPGGNMDGNQNATADSIKGIKAIGNISISGGEFNISTSDDAIHTNGDIKISGGTFALSAGDDGVHADGNVVIDGGNINITKSYEGIEGLTITINDGEINLVSSDDGFNGTSGTGSSGGRGGGMQAENGVQVTINGGYVYMNASGDGLDSNGNLTINGGVTLVDGPSNDGNGALDSNGIITVNGGVLIAAGSSGMAETPSSSSAQNSISAGTGSQQGGTTVCVLDESGNPVLTFAPEKSFSNIVFSSKNIETGKTYKVSVGGTATGDEKNGYYETAGYSGGSEIGSGTISSSVTTIGSAGGMNGGWGGGGGQDRPDRPF